MWTNQTEAKKNLYYTAAESINNLACLLLKYIIRVTSAILIVLDQRDNNDKKFIT
jgi:hypothetical protein